MLYSMLQFLEGWLGLLLWPLDIQFLIHRVQVPNSGGENILFRGVYDGLCCAIEAGSKAERDEGNC